MVAKKAHLRRHRTKWKAANGEEGNDRRRTFSSPSLPLASLFLFLPLLYRLYNRNALAATTIKDTEREGGGRRARRRGGGGHRRCHCQRRSAVQRPPAHLSAGARLEGERESGAKGTTSLRNRISGRGGQTDGRTDDGRPSQQPPSSTASWRVRPRPRPPTKSETDGRRERSDVGLAPSASPIPLQFGKGDRRLERARSFHDYSRSQSFLHGRYLKANAIVKMKARPSKHATDSVQRKSIFKGTKTLCGARNTC